MALAAHRQGSAVDPHAIDDLDRRVRIAVAAALGAETT
jgi:hypothetical protein